MMSSKNSKGLYIYNNNDVYKTLFAAILLPVLSPGAILAFHLSIKHGDGFHARCITWMQKEFATRRLHSSKSRISKLMKLSDKDKPNMEDTGNVGAKGTGNTYRPIWIGANHQNEDYNKSCENLANILGKVFQDNDGVLACGWIWC